MASPWKDRLPSTVAASSATRVSRVVANSPVGVSEIVNTVTYGGMETAQYPMAIYARWFRRFFTFVIPLACLNYFPAVGITGGSDPLETPVWVPWLSPLAGPLFLYGALHVWRFGVRRYRSTGS